MATNKRKPQTRTSEVSSEPAQIVREYGPFEDVRNVAGLTFDGTRVWFASNAGLCCLEPESGCVERRLDLPCDAGTAYDGRHLYQLAGAAILKIDPDTGSVVSSIPAPGQGRDSGLTWAEGMLWVGQYQDRKIVCIDPVSGKILKTLESDRFVTGVTWTDGELWHATWENEESELRRVHPETGEVLARSRMPAGSFVSGLEAARDVFYCGGGESGKVRAVRRPKRR